MFPPNEKIKSTSKGISLLSDDLVSEAIEEDFTDELPCTLDMEDSTQDLTPADQVSFSFLGDQSVCLKKTDRFSLNNPFMLGTLSAEFFCMS